MLDAHERATMATNPRTTEAVSDRVQVVAAELDAWLSDVGVDDDALEALVPAVLVLDINRD